MKITDHEKEVMEYLERSFQGKVFNDVSIFPRVKRGRFVLDRLEAKGLITSCYEVETGEKYFQLIDEETMAKKKQQEVPEKGSDTSQEVIKEVREADKDGNGFLPTMEAEVIIIPELASAIKENKLKLVPAFQSAQKALQLSKENIEALGQKYKEQLPLDEERQVRTYDDGEVHFEIYEKDTVSFSVVKEG